MTDSTPDKSTATDSASDSDSTIVMYESNWCGYCRAAKRLLSAKGWDYQSRLVDGDAQLRQEMQERSGRTSVPQIFFGERHIGGFDDMAALEEEGELEAVYHDSL